jgi:hypothetical protein
MEMKKDIKKPAGGKRAIKVSALLALLFAGNVAKGLAEEVVGMVLFEAEEIFGTNGNGYSYPVDTTGNSISDRQMIARRGSSIDPVFSTLTKYYLKPGVKFIFEDKGLKPFESMAFNRIIAIEINGNMVELTEMFSRADIKKFLPELYEKLGREGR